MKYGHIIILAVGLVTPTMAAWCNYGTNNPAPQGQDCGEIARFGAGTVHLLRLTMVAVLGLWLHVYDKPPPAEKIISLL
ncbi:hypothetical protein CcaCcLH18_01848 [Colletotrichum camelliae]|nr:hypothetical protein CcaCcLH18_01848 [Colletotrichum camelliae]